MNKIGGAKAITEINIVLMQRKCFTENTGSKKDLEGQCLHKGLNHQLSKVTGKLSEGNPVYQGRDGLSRQTDTLVRHGKLVPKHF